MTPGVEDVRDSAERWEVRRSVDHFSGPVISVRTDEVVMPDGSVAQRDFVTHPGAVGVIALDEQSRVLVLRQYRHPPARMLWEPPAGLLDVPGENPLLAAQRELYEEAHHEAHDWRVLVDFLNTPGASDEAVRVFLARDVKPVEDRDRHEGRHEETDMPLVWVPLDVLVERVLAGELHNPLLVIGALALHAVRDRLDQLRPADAPWPDRPFHS